MVHSFLKEVVIGINNNISLVLANHKEQINSTDFLIEKLLSERKEKIVFVSLTRTHEKIIQKHKDHNLIIIDGFSENKKQTENTIFIGPECNLTKLQIGFEKAMERANEKIIIVIDSLNRLAIYNNPKDLSKFIYLFSNKLKLEGFSGIFFAEKNSFEKNSLQKIESFSDKVFDYSGLSEININSINTL